MKIQDTWQRTEPGRFEPGSGFGDVGEGGLVLGVMGVEFSGVPTDGTIPFSNGGAAGTIDWVTLLGFFGNVISPPQITANTDDYAPTGLASSAVIRLDLDADHNLTGIVAPAVTGQRTVIMLVNVSAHTLTLKHDATSTGANRFYLSDDVDLALVKDTVVVLWYDPTSTRWRVAGSGGLGAFTGYTPADFELRNEGGQDLINPLGSVTGAVAVDPTLGNVATATLTGPVTATISAPVGAGQAGLLWWVTQDGVGSHALTIAATGGSVTNTTTPDTTAGVTVVYILERVPGSTNDWIVYLAGGSGATFATPAIVLGTAAAAGAATTVIRSDSTIVAFDATVPTTSAIGDAAATGSTAKAARRDHTHGREALSTATPLVESGAGTVGTGTKSSREDHVHPAATSSGSGIAFTVIGQETRASDGATVAWALDNDFEENSVQAFNLTSGKALTVTESVPNTVTIGAAGTAGDVLSFAYAASAI